MYIQITTRCNMKCDHCCYSCTRKGIDMDRVTYHKAIELAGEYMSYIAIGGGEPTVHPLFWEFIDTALNDEFIESVWLATNGKRTKDALKIVNYMTTYSPDKFSAELSQDEFHEPVSQVVVDAFESSGPLSYYGKRKGAIRTVTGKVLKQGRAEKTGVWCEEGCACDTLFVDPEGRIWNCGCKQVQFGTVDNPEIPGDYNMISGYDGGHDYAIKHQYIVDNDIEEYGGMK